MAVRVFLDLPTPGVNPGVEHVLPLTHTNKEVEEIVLAEVPTDHLSLLVLLSLLFVDLPERHCVLHGEGMKLGTDFWGHCTAPFMNL